LIEATASRTRSMLAGGAAVPASVGVEADEMLKEN
jgi:hypothetical protein